MEGDAHRYGGDNSVSGEEPPNQFRIRPRETHPLTTRRTNGTIPRPVSTRSDGLRAVARSRALRLVLLGLVVLGVVDAWRFHQRWEGFDFYTIWSASQAATALAPLNFYRPEHRPALRRGIEDLVRRNVDSSPRIIQAAVRRDVMDFKGFTSPLMFTLFAGVFTGEYERDYQRSFWLRMVAGAAGLALICSALGYSATALLAVLAFFLWRYEPLLSDLRVGNVNQLQLALVGLSVWLLVRTPRSQAAAVGAGATLALLVALKPNTAFIPMLLVVYWLVNRQMRTLWLAGGGAVLGLGLAVLGSLAAFGSAALWLDWLPGALRAAQSQYPVSGGNFSLVILIEALTGVYLPFELMALALLAAVASIWRARSPAAGDGEDRPEESVKVALVVGLGATLPLVSAALVWVHYLMLSLPLSLVLLRELAQGRVGVGRGAAGVGVAVLATLVLGHFSLLAKAGIPPLPALPLACVASLVGLFCLGLAALPGVTLGSRAAGDR